MDQVKVGNYISQKRKELGLTQKELAELIEVTDKSVSKWERGNGLPDVTRLKPLCDALKVSLNELIAGEDINESVQIEKMEENIMSLVKENEIQKKSGKSSYIIGGVLAVLSMCLLGISITGSSIYSVAYYLDLPSFIFVLLFIGVGVMFGKDKSKIGIWTMIQKLSVPVACFITLFQLVFILSALSDSSKLGPMISVSFLTPLYGVAVYIVSIIVKSHIE